MTLEIKNRLDNGEGERIIILSCGQSFIHEGRKLDGKTYARGVSPITLSIVYDWEEYNSNPDN